MEIVIKINPILCPQIELLIRKLLDQRDDCTVTYYKFNDDKLIVNVNL